MLTVKRIINGDIHLSEHDEDITIGTRGGKAYKEAINYTKNPTDPDGFDELLRTAESIREVQADTVELGGMESFQISGVTVYRDNVYGKETVLLGASPGTNEVTDAIGVLVTHINGPEECTVDYEFFYPGDELYIVNSNGKTVHALK